MLTNSKQILGSLNTNLTSNLQNTRYRLNTVDKIFKIFKNIFILPYWTRHLEFFRSNLRFMFSDPENPLYQIWFELVNILKIMLFHRFFRLGNEGQALAQ